MKGWHRESQRHALAARGIRTGNVPTKYRKKGYEVYVNGVYQGFTEDQEQAEEFADRSGGIVVDSKNRRKIIYRSGGILTNTNPSRTRRDGRYGVMVDGHFYDFTDDVMEAKEIAREVGGYIVYFTENPDPDRDWRNEIDRRRRLQEHAKWEEAWRNWRR